MSALLPALCAALVLPATLQAQSSSSPRTRFDRAAFNTGTQSSGAMLQDSDGFLWVGAVLGGLYRYDGYDLKAYLPGGAGSMSDASSFAIYEDTLGVLWIATADGLNRYDRGTDTFTQYRHDPTREDSISHHVWQFPAPQAIDGDGQGRIWLATRNGLNVLDPRTGRFRAYFHDSADPLSLSHNNVRAVLVDREGKVWAGTEEGLDRFDEPTETFTRFRVDPSDPGGSGSGRVTSLCQDQAGSLWIGTEDGLFRLDPGSSELVPYRHDPADPNTPSADYYLSLSCDSSGTVWLTYINARQAGLSALDPRTGTFTHYRHDPGDAFTLSANAISSAMEDRAGTIWVVNDSGIVDKLDPRKPPFVSYGATPDGLPSPAALRIIEDRSGTIWISTRPTGLTAFDKRTGRFTRYLTDRYYPAVLEDDTGTFWLSTTVPGTLHSFDPSSGRILRSWTHVPGDPTSLAATPQINDVVQDRQDPSVLWLVLYGAGIDRFDTRTGRFTHYTHDPDNPESVSSAISWMLYQDEDGELWIPTQGSGLDRLDPVTGITRHYRQDADGSSGPATDVLRCIFADPAGVLWIATSIGLDRMEPSSGIFTHFTEKTGYPRISAMTIGQDSTGVLWIGTTEEGLVRLDPKNGRMKVFTESDGIRGNAFYPWNALRDRDGEMWFGGAAGVTRFQPAGIVENSFLPPVVLTALKQGGEPLRTGSSPERVRSFSLDWRGNYFEFEYAALNYTQAEKNQYRYMLEGWDQTWFDAGTKRFGRYSGLRPGSYTLRITGSNNDGLWSTSEASVRVTVAPPWWQSWWFVTIATAAFGAVAFAFSWVVAGRRRAARAAERAIRESEERYRTLFENTPIGVSLTTAEGHLLAWNGVLEDMLGYTREDAPRVSVPGLYANPGDRERILDELKRNGKARDFETTWLKKDGQAIQVSLTVTAISLAGSPAFLTAVSDVSERKAAEAERARLLGQLREQADGIRRIVDAVPEGVFLLDAAGRVTLANPAAERALAMLAEGDPAEPVRLGNRLLAELLAPPPEGGWHEVAGPPGATFEVVARPIVADPVSQSWVLVLREVTREREMQQRVRQQEKLAAVGQLTAGIAHDFNNLLTTINGFAELGRTELAMGDDPREWMGTILESGQRAADLVRRLLAFSRRQVIEPRVVNLNEILAAMDRMLRRIIGEDVAWTPRFARDLWSVRADPTQIEQVIVNLAVNARDAMPGGGTLTVETANVVLDRDSAKAHGVEREGEHVMLSVSDTGVGMSEEVKKHLFEPFFTTKEQGKGTGLGLATVFGIVKQSGGAVAAYSEVGHGTVFRVYLPRAAESPTRETAGRSADTAASSPGGTILLVEDAAGVRELARRVLAKLRYQILEASDPAEALRVAEEHQGPIDLLLTDVIMPGMNGKDLADRLRVGRPGMRILFMSGYTDSVIEFHKLIESGASFLQKPFLPADLSRRVAEVLGASRR